MEEIEKHFQCPFCFERISMLLDLSIEGAQTYIEDCEVCCRPIQVTYEVLGGQMKCFQKSRSAG